MHWRQRHSSLHASYAEFSSSLAFVGQKSFPLERKIPSLEQRKLFRSRTENFEPKQRKLQLGKTVAAVHIARVLAFWNARQRVPSPPAPVQWGNSADRVLRLTRDVLSLLPLHHEQARRQSSDHQG